MFMIHPRNYQEGVTGMHKKTCLVALLGVLALSGCATTAQDSAKAAKEGYIYVVGSQEGKSAVWICPDKPGKGECEPVRVIMGK